MSSGFTLVETLVGVALVVIIFAGVFGAIQFATVVGGHSKAQVVASAVSTQHMENIRSLDYEDVGTKDGHPDGVLDAVSTTTSNTITFRVETRVDYVADDTDGLDSPEDDCPNDYKRVSVTASWQKPVGGEQTISSDVAPDNLAQECESDGGILTVQVINANANAVSSPTIEIKNATSGESVTSAIPSDGTHRFTLPAAAYEVVTTKTDYSTAESYDTDDVAAPDPAHPQVVNGEVTTMSFAIDKTSDVTVKTKSPWSTDAFTDTFTDTGKLTQQNNTNATSGDLILSGGAGSYAATGTATANGADPSDLLSWDALTFEDSVSTTTEAVYRLEYYATSSDSWNTVPDTDLSGNESSFTDSPVDLTGLATSTYHRLRITGELTSNNAEDTPRVHRWQLSWRTGEPSTVTDVPFTMRGAKTIGEDENGDPVYKYNAEHSSGDAGEIGLIDIEWDNYTFGLATTTDLNLVDTDPAPQPLSVEPDTSNTMTLYVRADDSLAVTVQEEGTADPVFAADVRVQEDGGSYDTTQETNEDGKTLFTPLESTTYTVTVSASDYATTTDSVSVSGDESRTYTLERLE